ncbi:MAG: acyltransferase [Pseudomonadota bacterium]
MTFGQKSDSLQALRGLAATLVAAFHLNGAGVEGSNYVGFFNLFSHGEVGVDIFFVISGFIIFYTSKLKRKTSVKNFIAGRFWRILPPYWAVLAIYVGLAIGLGVVFGDMSKIPTPRTLFDSFFLLPGPQHVITISWTLTIELVFYLVFAIGFFRFGEKRFLLTMVVWVILTQIYKNQDVVQSIALNFVLHACVLEFLFGVMIARLFLAGETRGQAPAFVIGVLLLLATMAGLFDDAPSYISREVLAGIPAALIIYGALGWRRPVPGIIMLWGEASFLLYLLHLIVFSVTGRLAEIVLGVDVYASTLWMLFMPALATVVSCLATLFIERPYQAWYKSRFTHRKKDGAAASVAAAVD